MSRQHNRREISDDVRETVDAYTILKRGSDEQRADNQAMRKSKMTNAILERTAPGEIVSDEESEISPGRRILVRAQKVLYGSPVQLTVATVQSTWLLRTERQQ